jgi:hypothetical protein
MTSFSITLMMGWPVRKIAFFDLQKGARKGSRTGWQDSPVHCHGDPARLPVIGGSRMAPCSRPFFPLESRHWKQAAREKMSPAG